MDTQKSLAPVCVWITGLPASGKSTLALALKAEIEQRNLGRVYILDGDVVRTGLNSDLGYGARDRAESVRRVGEVARMMVDAGLVVIVSLISPFRTDRDAVRQVFPDGKFFVTHMDTPLAVCEQRDPKGHYRRARAGELAEFTGVSSPYENPSAPDFHVAFDGTPPHEIASRLIEQLKLA